MDGRYSTKNEGTNVVVQNVQLPAAAAAAASSKFEQQHETGLTDRIMMQLSIRDVTSNCKGQFSDVYSKECFHF
jgi:hypothetical protein